MERPAATPPTVEPRRGSFVRALGGGAAVALIVGNMVGTSIYTLPASLASEVGPLGIVAWVLTALGYALVAAVYARLAGLALRSGGPYVFVRGAFGDFAGFVTVWSYWWSAVVGNAAIALGVVAYAVEWWPGESDSPWRRFVLAQALLLGLTALNARGARHFARLQVVVVTLSLVTLLVLCAAAFRHFDPQNLRPFAPDGWSRLPVGMALIVWAYAGIESATVPSEELRGNCASIPRATWAGYALATLAFLASALAIAGSLPNEAIAASARPTALAMERALGPIGGTVVAVAAVLAGVGTLNGWILMVGRIPVSAAEDGLFFPALARIDPRHGTPKTALWVSAAIGSVLLGFLFSKSLLELFQFIALLAVFTTLVPHLLTMAARLRDVLGQRPRPIAEVVLAAAASGFVLFTLASCGLQVVALGSAVIAAGLPLYFVLRARRAQGLPKR